MMDKSKKYPNNLLRYPKAWTLLSNYRMTQLAKKRFTKSFDDPAEKMDLF